MQGVQLYQELVRVQRHPSKHYIRYLLMLGEGDQYGPDFVNRSLADLGLLQADPDSIQEEAEWVRSRGSRPSPFIPAKKTKKAQEYFEELGVQSLAMEEPTAVRATEVLGILSLREDLETGLLGRVRPARLEDVLCDRYGVGVIDLATIQAYSHYYFNASAMTVQEWALWLDSPDSDRRLAVLRGGPNLALHRLGLRVNMESSSMLTHIQQSLFFRFLEADQLPTTPKTLRMLTDTAKEIRNVSELRRVTGNEIAETMEKFERFHLETDPVSKVVDIHALSPDGGFTGSGEAGGA